MNTCRAVWQGVPNLFFTVFCFCFSFIALPGPLASTFSIWTARGLKRTFTPPPLQLTLSIYRALG